MEGYNLVKVSKIAKIILGGTPKRSEEAYWGGRIKWASAKDITSVNTRYIYDTEERITELGLKESNTKLLPKNTIVITARGTVGAMAMLSEDMAFNQSCYGLISKDGIDPDYLFYALKASLSKIFSVSYGTVFDTITMKSFDSIEIPVPSIEEQKRIAHILGTLDDKIELNQQMNETLEAIARAIFKSWFVDFDPVKAKMAGEPYPLPDEIMALFPDALVESELGMIPKGWEYKPFGKLLSFHLGGDWGKAERQGEYQIPVRIIRGTDLPDLHNGGIGEVPLRHLKESSFEKRELKDGDIIIEISGGSKGQPTGRSLYVTEKLINRFDVPIIPTSFCRLFRPKDQALSVLLNIHLRIIYDEGKTWKYQNQSTGISNFQSTYFLENELVLVPTNTILNEFKKLTYPLIFTIQNNQSITLEKIRNTLLPEIMFDLKII